MTEVQLHKAVAAYLRVALRPPVIWTTIGHGGGGRVRGAQLKAMGVQKGWPDIIVFAPGWITVGLELKTKAGRQSPEQRALATAFEDCGAHYALCRSIDEVQAALEYCKVPIHARTRQRLRLVRTAA